MTNKLNKKAIGLVAKGYTELNPTTEYRLCNEIFIDSENKTFWFTTKETAKHTKQLANIKTYCKNE
ncbi:hypothetical protein [Wenyingzhuangia sp. 2_MG-2023]|uniref:hypothetical protein n=1 Tax=Wenyingzhuangia sp. 2_MG-2023 TaxID=3062639 RepID=UPI0026E4889C|nr:hypothetical protein [Wenyingzhuangia sp. 2_MG-2023]MDO6737136.1 hypothetical protein [Wenyingzhuangia sp. 2_MG-2023]